MSRWAEILANEEEKESKPKKTEAEKAAEKANDDGEELKTFIQNRQYQLERQKVITSVDYYFIVCFADEEKLKECCDMLGLDSNLAFVDGVKLSERLGYKLDCDLDADPRAKSSGKDYAWRTLDARHYTEKYREWNANEELE